MKNSFTQGKDLIIEKRKLNCKSVDKITEKYFKNNFVKFLDDTNFNLKKSNFFSFKSFYYSTEKETTSKDSKELSYSTEETFSISHENSFDFLVTKKKTFKNLQKEKNIFLKAFYPEKNEEIYDENKKYDFLKKIKPKGLLNLGGCCYMNATLQCFYHIKELTYYFLDNKKEIKRKNGVLSLGYLDLVEGLSKINKETRYVPQKFKESLLEIDETFEGSEGKDSADLVDLFLYNCQMELGGEPDFPDLSIDKKQERLIYFDLYYKKSKVPSIISELFQFEIISTSKCFQCGESFYNISTENSLLFSLEAVYDTYIEFKKKENANLISNKKSVSVEECLTHYVLDGALRENTNCKYCKKETSIFTTRAFGTLPKIIIMIMNRGEREKFECNVDFKEDLNLEDLYTGIKGIEKEKNKKYSLLAGTILYGSGGWGHTVAFAKHFNGEYYIFNDSSTRKTNFDEIKKSKVYLLFYKKLE